LYRRGRTPIGFPETVPAVKKITRFVGIGVDPIRLQQKRPNFSGPFCRVDRGESLQPVGVKIPDLPADPPTPTPTSRSHGAL